MPNHNLAETHPIDVAMKKATFWILDVVIGPNERQFYKMLVFPYQVCISAYVGCAVDDYTNRRSIRYVSNP